MPKYIRMVEGEGRWRQHCYIMFLVMHAYNVWLPCACMHSRVKRLVPSICIFICIYVYMCVCDQKKRLFCILPVVIHRKSLYNACS